jgi:hypothetical protein
MTNAPKKLAGRRWPITIDAVVGDDLDGYVGRPFQMFAVQVAEAVVRDEEHVRQTSAL